MAGEEQPQNKSSWITRLFSNPVYSGVASLVGVIGVILSIWFYIAGREVPDLTYYVSPTRTAIVTAEQTQKLSVAYAGQPVHGDISSAQITIWNAGRKPISHSDLLTAPTLTANSPILDEKVLNESRPLIGFSVDNSYAARGLLTLDWRILEHNDGVRLQIIYAGEPDARIALDGAIIGQSAPSERLITADQAKDPAWTIGVGGIAFTLLIIGGGSSLYRAIIWRYRNRRDHPFSRAHWILAGVFFVTISVSVGAILFLTLRALYTAYLNVPPFGF